MIGGVYSDDNNLQLEATTQFRKLLSIGTNLLNVLGCYLVKIIVEQKLITNYTHYNF
jgi:hypothetical protein